MPKARFKGTCQCGQNFASGASVRFERISGQLVVTECPTCKPEVHGAGEAPSAPLELRVKVMRVRFVKPDGSWTVTEALLDDMQAPADSPLREGEPFSLVGALGSVRVDDLIEVFGNFQHDPKWGWQFIAQRAIAVVAGTEQSLRAFLARFPHVGKKRAEQILRKLGSREAVVEALEKDPLALTVVDGITEERARAIAAAYLELGDLRESAKFLAGLELGEGLTAQILDRYGADAKQVVSEDPYQLMELPGIGFKRADDLGRRLKIPANDPRRLAAATLFLLEETESDGHTFATVNDLLSVS